MKKHKTFKTPMMDSCNTNFQKIMNGKFEVAFVGLQTINGRYVLNAGQENAALLIKGNKEFTTNTTLKIVAQLNDIMPNLSTGEFKTEVDGIKFNCNVQRV